MDLTAKVLLGRVFECESDRGNPVWQIFVQNGDDKPTAEAAPKAKRKAPKPPAGPLPFDDPLPI